MNQTNEHDDDLTGNTPEDDALNQQSAPDAETSATDKLELQLRRAMADLANLRKRQSKDLQDARQRAVESLAAQILPVLDNFHLALGAAEGGRPGDVSSMVEGLNMVRGMLEGVLAGQGLTEIPAEGADFDPNLHEAVGVDNDSDAEPGVITKVMQRGYRIHDKVLRASRVLVKGETAPSDS